MRRHFLFLLLTLAVGWAGPARAQTPQWVSALLEAARLPVITLEARRDGVRDTEIAGLLGALRNAHVAAPDAVIIVDSARAVRHDYGPVDNFGAFVQSQLAAGKRGTELAAAIRLEHARMGKGQGNAAHGGPAGDVEHGRGTNANPPVGRGRGNAGGTHADSGDDHGRPRGGAVAPPPKPARPATGKPAEKPHGKPADRGNGRPTHR